MADRRALDGDWARLGHELRRRRRELEMPTQRLAAQRTGIHLNTWNKVEAGKNVSTRSLQRVVEAVGWDMTYALGVLSGQDMEEPVRERPRPPERVRTLCEQAQLGAEGGWVSADVGAFAAAVLTALEADRG